MNVEIGTGAAQFLFCEYINGIFVAVWTYSVAKIKVDFIIDHFTTDFVCNWHRLLLLLKTQLFFHDTLISADLKVHKIEIFFGFDFEICIISLLVMSKY